MKPTWADRFWNLAIATVISLGVYLLGGPAWAGYSLGMILWAVFDLKGNVIIFAGVVRDLSRAWMKLLEPGK